MNYDMLYNLAWGAFAFAVIICCLAMIWDIYKSRKLREEKRK